jgi:hypothetical protein
MSYVKWLVFKARTLFFNQTLPRRYSLFGGIARYCLMKSEDPADPTTSAKPPMIVSALEDLEVKSIDKAEFSILSKVASI